MATQSSTIAVPVRCFENSATPTSTRQGPLLGFWEMEGIEARLQEEGRLERLALKRVFGPNPEGWDDASDLLAAMVAKVRHDVPEPHRCMIPEYGVTD